MKKNRRVIVIDVVGLRPEHPGLSDICPNISSLAAQGCSRAMRPVFPAVTLPVQASLTTGLYPQDHGITANGCYFRENFQVSFWEQAASLVGGERIWDTLRRHDPSVRTASLFLQNTLYAGCETVVTPRPLHTDDGLVQWCYSKPPGFYETICESIGEFNLMSYWGPMASIDSSRWIASAAVETLARIQPDLMFVYLPHLDYCSQKLGPNDPGITAELSRVDREVGRIVRGAAELGRGRETAFILLSEYAFSEVSGAVPINRLLREKGLLEVRAIKGREYLDFELSPAFAMVDHQVAHVFVKAGWEKAVRSALETIDGIDRVLDAEGKRQQRVDHPRSGEFIAVSARDRWFSYYWWEDPEREPDFAGRVDIHRKPGYDPLELFIEPKTFRIPQDTNLVRGSHGYPAVSSRDLVPLVISGDIPGGLRPPEEVCITDVAGIIREMLGG